tara:strand:+ start:1520 stop:4954 length:3435 start_codon:yes stop_codon:yes gene_type:complete
MDYIGLKNDKLQPVDQKEVEYELESPNSFFGLHANLVPLQGSLQGPRLFYGAKFQNQALPLVKGEAPFVQSLVDGDESGASFDDIAGRSAGAATASVGGEVLRTGKDSIDIMGDDGEKKTIPIYNNFLFNRKTAINSKPIVKKGDRVEQGQIIAKSNYTDDNGTLSLGLNARIGVVPYKGHSLDDSIVISEAFAKRMSSDHMESFSTDYKKGVKGGKAHHMGIFGSSRGKDYYNNEQLDKLDDDGVAKVGQILYPGDPMILATKPKSVSSSSAQLGKLSNFMKNSRSDATQTWEGAGPGLVTDVVKNKNRAKLSVQSVKPSKVGDKIVFRSGQKGVISKIIPDEHMPRTVDGKNLEVLLNPLGIPSRINNSIIYEILLGKVAAKKGKPFKLPSFNKQGEKWYDFVQQQLDENGIPDVEEVFDPQENKKLENPITVGNGYLLKLHHTSGSKVSGRAQGAYDVNEQPLKGGDDMAKSKRISGLEDHALLSAGAYGVLKDMSILRGAKNDEYWQSLREGHDPKTPDTPFVWNKFIGLMSGAGYQARRIKGTGKMRLGPMTDKALEELKPYDVQNGELVDLRSLEPVKGGLFDNGMLFTNKYGRIKLPFEIPHPGMEETIKKILGIKAGEFDAIMAGGMELPDHLKERLGLLKKEASEDQFLPDFSPEELKEMGVYDQVYGDEKSEASMKEWPEHWLHKQDPLGWLQWYERYAGGRRTEDDLRQIKRWLSFKARHGSQYLKNPTDRRRAALRNWAINVENLSKEASVVEQPKFIDLAGPKLTGPEAITAALKTFTVDELEERAVADLKTGKKSKRGDAVKLLRAVKGFRRNEMTPADYVIKNVPVVPPKFRPFNVVGDAFVPGAANELYRDLFTVLDSHKEIQTAFGDEFAGDNKNNVYKSVKAVYGFGDPVLPKTKYRGVSGFLQQILGNNSKFSFFQRKAVSKPVDFTGRGVIGVDPDLDLDQIGIPKNMAFKIYSPYIQRELVRGGMPRSEALKAVVDEKPEAFRALGEVIKERPVIYSRSPAWHKFNVTAAYPKVIDGDTIMINPLVTSGHNADFDGDTMNIHVPGLPEAVDDAKNKLLPSKMLFSIKKREQVVPAPTQELILGLYTAQKRAPKNKHVFASEEEALKAIKLNQVKLSDEIEIAK